MAEERTGVTNEARSPGAAGGQAAFAKKNRKWLIAGGAVAVILYMSHKGSGLGGGSQTDPNAQLQAQQDALAAEESALTAGPLQPGGGTSIDTGGGASVLAGPSSTSAPGATNVTINEHVPNPDKDDKLHRKPPGHRPPHPKQKHHDPDHDHDKDKKGKPDHDKPGKTHGNRTGGAPITGKKQGEDVESVHGAGDGVVVHGREFPGAVSHVMHAPRVHADGSVHQDVTVHFGGHSETHTSINGGQRWHENSANRTPPTRRMAVR